MIKNKSMADKVITSLKEIRYATQNGDESEEEEQERGMKKTSYQNAFLNRLLQTTCFMNTEKNKQEIGNYPGLIGLKNQNNSCFVNAGLQVKPLIALEKPFTIRPKSQTVDTAWHNLVWEAHRKFKEETYTTIDASELRTAVGKLNPRCIITFQKIVFFFFGSFSSGCQHDAFSLLNAVLDELEGHYRGKSRCEFWEELKSNGIDNAQILEKGIKMYRKLCVDASPICKLFDGIEYNTVCPIFYYY
ncbi:hypothetical protein RFI_33834, partial [Reticulomyxa filosa]